MIISFLKKKVREFMKFELFCQIKFVFSKIEGSQYFLYLSRSFELRSVTQIQNNNLGLNFGQ